jgi:hypothetical protein
MAVALASVAVAGDAAGAISGNDYFQSLPSAN